MKPSPPIIIENGIMLPKGNQSPAGRTAQLREAISKMKFGQSFMWADNFLPYDAAEQIGATISTRKINGSGYRVWKVRAR